MIRSRRMARQLSSRRTYLRSECLRADSFKQASQARSDMFRSPVNFCVVLGGTLITSSAANSTTLSLYFRIWNSNAAFGLVFLGVRQSWSRAALGSALIQCMNVIGDAYRGLVLLFDWWGFVRSFDGIDQEGRKGVDSITSLYGCPRYPCWSSFPFYIGPAHLLGISFDSCLKEMLCLVFHRGRAPSCSST